MGAATGAAATGGTTEGAELDAPRRLSRYPARSWSAGVIGRPESVVWLEAKSLGQRRQDFRLFHRVYAKVRFQLERGVQVLKVVPRLVSNDGEQPLKRRTCRFGRCRNLDGGSRSSGYRCGCAAGLGSAVREVPRQLLQRGVVREAKRLIALEAVLLGKVSQDFRLLDRVNAKIRLQLKIWLELGSLVAGLLRHHLKEVSKCALRVRWGRGGARRGGSCDDRGWGGRSVRPTRRGASQVAGQGFNRGVVGEPEVIVPLNAVALGQFTKDLGLLDRVDARGPPRARSRARSRSSRSPVRSATTRDQTLAARCPERPLEGARAAGAALAGAGCRSEVATAGAGAAGDRVGRAQEAPARQTAPAIPIPSTSNWRDVRHADRRDLDPADASNARKGAVLDDRSSTWG